MAVLLGDDEEETSGTLARLKVSGGRPVPECAAYHSFGWRPLQKTKASIWEGERESLDAMRRIFEGFGYTVKEVK
jgi:hypothetical protein